MPAGNEAVQTLGPDGFAGLLDDRRQQLVLRFAFAKRGDQVLGVVGHVVERLGSQDYFGRTLGLDAHRMVALTETVRAVGKHAQRSEIAAEYQPDELQHEEQRHGDDLYLLDELLPEPVLVVDRSYGGSERSIRHPAGPDIDALFAVLDGDNPREPLRRLTLGLPVLSGQCLAVPGDPLESGALGPLDLLFQQLADRLVSTDQRLIGHQRREESERFSLLA